MQSWPEKPSRDTPWFLGSGIGRVKHALQSLAATFISLWMGAFSLKVLVFVGSPAPLTSLAQRAHLPTNLTLVLLMPFLFIPLINYVLNVLLCLQDIGDKTRNCSCPLDSDDRWGRSCYSQPCRAEGACITQGSYEPYWAGLPKMDRGHSEGFWQNGVHWRRDGKPVQYSCRENLINSMKR